MSIARESFLQRIEALKAILNNPISIDLAPIPIPGSPQIVVRNGAMVMLFCSLETFIRDRALEVLSKLNHKKVPYQHLSSELKYACSVGTFEGLMNATRYFKEVDKISEFERLLPKASKGASGFKYFFTEYSFGRDKSNLGKDDIQWLLKGFAIKDNWDFIRVIANNNGITFTNPPSEEFTNIAKDRHRAAHVGKYIVDYAKLVQYIPSTIAIALGFDIAISMAVLRINSTLGSGGTWPTTDTSHVKIRTLKPDTIKSNFWNLEQAGLVKSLGKHLDSNLIFAKAGRSAIRGGECLIEVDSSLRPVKWITAAG